MTRSSPSSQSRAPLEPDPPPAIPGMLAQWMLDPAQTFLNHGSFGARLRGVVDAQSAWRERMEARPVAVLDVNRGDALADARDAIGRFLNMKPGSFGFVTNASDGVNAVLRSFPFAPGDEIVTTSHVYNAVRQTMRFLADRHGVVPREVRVAAPFDDDGIVATLTEALSARTRLLLVDHVTSPTAVLFPVERLARICAERGIDILVDGAHAPGMLDLDVSALGVTYYTGNLHKWVCAPLGTAILWVSEERRTQVHPTIISHGFGVSFADEFAWQGTRDISGWLTVPEAIRALGELLSGGWPTLRERNHAMATWAQRELCRSWDVAPLSTLDGSMLGSMAAVRCPQSFKERFDAPQQITQYLYDEHRIEVPAHEWDGDWLIRVSAQAYNEASDYEQLARVVMKTTSTSA